MSRSSTLVLLSLCAFSSKTFQAQANDHCYLASCGCPGSYLQSWCTESNAFVNSDWCQETEERCGDCSGTWCGEETLPQEGEGCYISNCGCPDNYLQSWCTEENALVNSDWCQQDEGKCLANCAGTWCGSGSSSVTTNSPTKQPIPSPTDAPIVAPTKQPVPPPVADTDDSQSTDHCYLASCGCPGSYLQSWCTESNAFVNSDWCQETEERCGDCSGTWCGEETLPQEGEGCYISNCGCPDNYLQSWCTEENALVNSDWCQQDEGKCLANCAGTWCGSGSSSVTTNSPTNQPIPSPTDAPVTPGGGGGGSRTCFSGDDMLTLHSGEQVKFSQLKIGDRVLSSTRDGQISHSKVVFLPHGENLTPTRFLEVVTESKKKVKMTAGHLIPLCSGKLVSAHELTATKKSKLTPEFKEENDYNCLRTIHGNEKISSIKTVTARGVYTAVTENEFLVVNGIIASPFASSAVLAHAYFNITDMRDWCSSHNWLVHDMLKTDPNTKRFVDVLHNEYNHTQHLEPVKKPSEDCMALLTNMFEKFKDEPIGWGVNGWGYRGWANPSSRKKLPPPTKHSLLRKKNDQKEVKGISSSKHVPPRSRLLEEAQTNEDALNQESLKHVPLPGLITGWE